MARAPPPATASLPSRSASASHRPRRNWHCTEFQLNRLGRANQPNQRAIAFRVLSIQAGKLPRHLPQQPKKNITPPRHERRPSYERPSNRFPLAPLSWTARLSGNPHSLHPPEAIAPGADGRHHVEHLPNPWYVVPDAGAVEAPQRRAVWSAGNIMDDVVTDNGPAAADFSHLASIIILLHKMTQLSVSSMSDPAPAPLLRVAQGS